MPKARTGTRTGSRRPSPTDLTDHVPMGHRRQQIHRIRLGSSSDPLARGPLDQARVPDVRVIGLSLPEGPLEVLCLGAHPDDIEIGCGGTLLMLAAAHPLRVTLVIMTAATPERRAEAIASAAEFPPGVDVDVQFGELPDGRLPAHWDRVALTARYGANRRPQLIFAPRTDDAHQDHPATRRTGAHRVARLPFPALRDAEVGR